MKEPLLISECLLGVTCRYDGKSKPMDASLLIRLMEQYELIPVCPEQLGGLKTPRAPSERQEDGTIVSNVGEDVTVQYHKGAEQALHLAGLFQCRKALLKERSPSCGNGVIYDGSFSGKLTDGNGVTADLLLENGITVIGESSVQTLLE